jgi:uroporphyrinogen-III synthase
MNKISSILISQPKPEAEKSPYFDLEKKYNVKLQFRQLIQVVPVLAKDFRKDKINITDYTAIILNSRNAIDHLFRICEEMRIKLSQETKFFCSSEAIALYLQKYTQYRKRKVFFSSDNTKSLHDLLLKHKDNERFLWPCSDQHQDELPEFLDKHSFKYDKAVIYRTVSSDVKDLVLAFDVIVFFSPAGVKSLFENFPDFKQGNVLIGTMGVNTAQAAKEAGLTIQILAPNPETPSMVTALDNFLKVSNK